MVEMNIKFVIFKELVLMLIY